MAEQLEGKIAVITGAASGIGAAVSRVLHDNGALLVLADRAESVFDLATQLGQRAVAVRGNVGNSADAARMVDLAVSRYGGVDILCNIAGIGGDRGALAECSEENFENLVGVNLRGPFLTMKAAIPPMIARGGGSIVNVASTAALKGFATLAVYSASKAALVSMTKGAAVEYAKQGIRVNAICPGPIETPMYSAVVDKVPGGAERIVAGVPMGRAGQPSEIAYPVLFLASAASSFVTGAVLTVDGGHVA